MGATVNEEFINNLAKTSPILAMAGLAQCPGRCPAKARLTPRRGRFILSPMLKNVLQAASLVVVVVGAAVGTC
jgi:hypothetical protein